MKKKYNITATLISLLVLSACQEEATLSVDTAATNNPSVTEVKTESQASSAADESINGVDSPLIFSLTNLDGEIINAADFRGKWLVINYWATWCAPCREEMPELVKFQTDHADNVQVIGIAYEDAEIQKLKNFAADFNVNYPLLTIDVYQPPGFAEEGGLGLPTTIVYDPQGIRHKKHMGPIDVAGLLEMIQ